MEPYRLSYIGWTPSQQSIYHSIMGAISIPTNKLLTQPLLRRLGNRFSCTHALSAYHAHDLILTRRLLGCVQTTEMR